MLEKPRDRKPKIGTQLWVQAFHEHLDHCKRCADNPFDLCIVGSSLEHDWMAQHHILDFRNWLIEKLWTAAAVSKNLQEAYDREHAWLNNAATEANCDLNEVAGAIMQLKASVEQLCGDLKAIQQDYTNEKELAEKLEK